MNKIIISIMTFSLIMISTTYVHAATGDFICEKVTQVAVRLKENKGYGCLIENVDSVVPPPDSEESRLDLRSGSDDKNFYVAASGCDKRGDWDTGDDEEMDVFFLINITDTNRWKLVFLNAQAALLGDKRVRVIVEIEGPGDELDAGCEADGVEVYFRAKGLIVLAD